MEPIVFTQAIRTIRNHPQVANVKRLHIRNRSWLSRCWLVADEVGRLFWSLGPLENLTLHHYDLRPYLHSFINPPEGDHQGPIVFPPIKRLVILFPMKLGSLRSLALVELTESQHALGIPFEHVVIRKGEGIPGD